MSEREMLLDANYLIYLLEGKVDKNDANLLQKLKTLRAEISANKFSSLTPANNIEKIRLAFFAALYI